MDSHRDLARVCKHALGTCGYVLAALLVALAAVPASWAQDVPAANRPGGSAAKASAGKEAPAAKDEKSAADKAEARARLRTTQQCIDKEIADRLAVKRKRRGAVDRLFVKQARHELTLAGGYYSSDLFSGTYALGGSYTFHMTEDTAVELGAVYTHANADIIRAIEASRGNVLDEDYARVLVASSLLVWSPVYGKLRLGGVISRFDLHLDAGVGVVDSQTSRGTTGIFGGGMKLFIGKAVALRIDARTYVFRQELLAERFLVTDTAVTSGLSLFLPFRN